MGELSINGRRDVMLDVLARGVPVGPSSHPEEGMQSDLLRITRLVQPWKPWQTERAIIRPVEAGGAHQTFFQALADAVGGSEAVAPSARRADGSNAMLFMTNAMTAAEALDGDFDNYPSIAPAERLQWAQVLDTLANHNDRHDTNAMVDAVRGFQLIDNSSILTPPRVGFFSDGGSELLDPDQATKTQLAGGRQMFEMPLLPAVHARLRTTDEASIERAFDQLAADTDGVALRESSPATPQALDELLERLGDMRSTGLLRYAR